MVALEHLTSNISHFSNCGIKKKNGVSTSKIQFFHLCARQNLSHNYNIFLENTQLKPSFVTNSLGVSFSCDFNWKNDINSLSKQSYKVFKGPFEFIYAILNAFSFQGRRTSLKRVCLTDMRWSHSHGSH